MALDTMKYLVCSSEGQKHCHISSVPAKCSHFRSCMGTGKPALPSLTIVHISGTSPLVSRNKNLELET